MTFRFGIYAGGLGADQDGRVTPGPPESPAHIDEALDALQGAQPFVVRGYVLYGSAGGPLRQAPPQPWRHTRAGRRLDLVVCFREPGEDLTGWVEFLRGLIRAHGDCLDSIQVAEEANHDGPGGDGGFPAVRRAIVEGVLAARAEVDRLGLDVGVGCNSTPILDPEQEFWSALGRLGGREFVDALDYVALDFFPDVFRPIPPERLSDAVAGVLRGFRQHSLAAAGIPAGTPMRIGENGWPTGPGRSERRQVEVLRTVVEQVVAAREELNIQGYRFFGLRDADSTRAQAWYGFGLMRSDYTPKPAFEAYRQLVERYTVA